MKKATLKKNGTVEVEGKVVGRVLAVRRGFRALLGFSGAPTQSTFATAREAAEIVALNANATLSN